jgi:hypothetical protein
MHIIDQYYPSSPSYLNNLHNNVRDRQGKNGLLRNNITINREIPRQIPNFSTKTQLIEEMTILSGQ